MKALSRFVPAGLLIWVSLVLPGSAVANPLPESVIFTHVQPADPVNPPPITECSQIVQYTEATGELEFDLYLHLVGPPYGVESLEIQLGWPESWTFTGYQVPQGGGGIISVNGNQASVELNWPDCMETEHEVLLLLRCFVTVDGLGNFGQLGYPNTVMLCSPENLLLEPEMYAATAGVVCDYCYTGCWLGFLCAPTTEVPLLDLQVTQGQMVMEEILYHMDVEPGESCDALYEGTEDWMMVSGAPAGGWDHILTLVIDTTEMEPGSYTGWVRMESDCAACTLVNLEVLSHNTGVDNTASWSRIKAAY